MQAKKIITLSAIIFFIYAIGTYVYFSEKPFSRYHCPVSLSNQVTIKLDDPNYPDHKFQTINDASCLNQTRVYDIINIKTAEDIKEAIKTAREKKLHISIAGVRHSMGGQAFFDDALVLNMTGFNKIINLDEKNKILTVQSGATWHDIQTYLHEKNLAVKAMQSSDIFTVGGSLSVNAHGMDHTVGSIHSTIKSFTIMLSNGNIQKISRTKNLELFNAVIGGYGLFGIVLEVELEVTNNEIYKRDSIHINYQQFPEFFNNAMQEKRYSLFYAHMSTSPFSFLKDMVIYGYKKVEHEGPFEPLNKISLTNLRRFLINLSKRRQYAQVFKWIAEKYIDPILEKNQKNKLLSRNAIMHDSVEYLENIIVDETDILHEYFIPHKNFVPYIDQMRAILKKSKIPVLNVSIRSVHKESNFLNYAPEDMFAIVLYLNQKINKKAISTMKELTRDLIDLTLKFEGTFFLPYQLYFSKEQLKKAYPNIQEFFDLKIKYDPEKLFMNKFYSKYAK